MKCLTHDEIVKIIEDAFRAGYQAGTDNAAGMLSVEDFQEYLSCRLSVCWADCQPHKSGDLHGQSTKFLVLEVVCLK